VRQRIYNRQRHVHGRSAYRGRDGVALVSYPKLAASAYCEPRCFEYLRCPYRFDSMRRCGPTRQRLWLGSSRYLRCRGRKHPNADAHCHSDSQSHRIRRQKVHDSGDAISVIQVEGRSTLGTEGSLISGAGSERLGPFQPQPLLSNEKEICVSLCPP
jgi:hypothetical protein